MPLQQLLMVEPYEYTATERVAGWLVAVMNGEDFKDLAESVSGIPTTLLSYFLAGMAASRAYPKWSAQLQSDIPPEHLDACRELLESMVKTLPLEQE